MQRRVTTHAITLRAGFPRDVPEKLLVMTAVRKVIQETMSALPDPEPRPKKARRGVWCEDCKIKVRPPAIFFGCGS